jgi:hypothetical protein
MAVPFLRHTKVKGVAPEAATVNETLCPTVVESDCGCVVMVGGKGATLTVKTAVALVVDPAAFDTVTE